MTYSRNADPMTAYGTEGIPLDRLEQVRRVVTDLSLVSHLAGFTDRIAITNYDATGNNPEVVWYRVDWVPGEEPRVVGAVEVEQP